MDTETKKGFKYGLTFGNVSYQLLCNFILIAFTILCIFPFYYLIINSISANNLSAQGQINFWPQGIHFSNYMTIFRLRGLARAAQVSVSRTVLGTIIPVLVSAYMGYMFTKPMWGRKFWYRFVVASMYFHAGLIPFFLTIMNLGLLNNFWVYIIPGIMQPFNILLVKTFIESTPESLQEAAEIDGAGTFRIFFYVILPIIKPILATIAIFSAVGQWNAWADTLYYIQNPNLYPLQYLLYKMLQNNMAEAMRAGNAADSASIARNLRQELTPAALRLTMTCITTLPILLVYPFMQRYFVKGMLLGAIKG